MRLIERELMASQAGSYSALIARLLIIGLKNTLIVTIGGIAIGVSLGCIFATVKAAYKFNGDFKKTSRCVSLITTILRGTPALMQLLILRSIFGGGLCVAIVAFGLNSSAYVSEIVKSGIIGLGKEQYNEGLSLGFKSTQVLRLIIMPQVLRNSIPTLTNEASALLKETAILGEIGVLDLTKAAESLKPGTSPLVSLLIASLIYLVIVLGIMWIADKLQKKPTGRSED